MFSRLLTLGCLLLAVSACNLAKPSPTPLPTQDAPTVEIIAPPNNATVIEGTDFTIDMVARDAGSGVSKIELLVDGSLINQVNPFDNAAEPIFRAQINWVALGEGKHLFEAIAYRPDGQRSDSAFISIEVLPATP